MPIEASQEGGSLPTPATSSGSASPLRRPCRNCKVTSDIRKHCRAHGIGNSVHMHTDVSCALPDRHGPYSVDLRDHPPGSRFEAARGETVNRCSEFKIPSKPFRSTMRLRSACRPTVRLYLSTCTSVALAAVASAIYGIARAAGLADLGRRVDLAECSVRRGEGDQELSVHSRDAEGDWD